MVAFLAAFAFTWFQDSNASTRSLVGSSCCAMTILIVWCIYVSWEKKVTPDIAERPLVYMDPTDPCEEISDGQPSLKEEMQEPSFKSGPPALMAIGRFLKSHGPFKDRRESYDSGKTAVTAADV